MSHAVVYYHKILFELLPLGIQNTIRKWHRVVLVYLEIRRNRSTDMGAGVKIQLRPRGGRQQTKCCVTLLLHMCALNVDTFTHEYCGERGVNFDQFISNRKSSAIIIKSLGFKRCLFTGQHVEQFESNYENVVHFDVTD